MGSGRYLLLFESEQGGCGEQNKALRFSHFRIRKWDNPFGLMESGRSATSAARTRDRKPSGTSRGLLVFLSQRPQ